MPAPSPRLRIASQYSAPTANAPPGPCNSKCCAAAGQVHVQLTGTAEGKKSPLLAGVAKSDDYVALATDDEKAGGRAGNGTEAPSPGGAAEAGLGTGDASTTQMCEAAHNGDVTALRRLVKATSPGIPLQAPRSG